MTIDGSSIGRRMTIRYVVGGRGPSGGPAMTDVIGRILELTERSLTVERRDGSAVVVALADIVAAKVVPDAPTRSRAAMSISDDDLTRITSRGWPAIDSEDLGDWELRASAGFTFRANTVSVTGSPGVPDDEAFARIDAFYAAHGQPPVAQAIVGSAGETLFRSRGWVGLDDREAGSGAIVQVAELMDGMSAEGVRIERRVTPEWLERYHRVEDDRDVARAVLEGPATVGFLSIGDPIVAIGRVAVTGEWAGLACVEVAPEHRREGLGRRIVEASIAWAREHGADKAYLQTKFGNDAAIALYAPYGFRTHHEYVYLVPPEGMPGSST